MIVGCGIDVIEVDRIRRAGERFGRRFLERIFTPGEIAYVERKKNRWERYAARFAAKEAGMKALGTGLRRGVRWRDFEVANAASGKPELRLHGEAARIAARLGIKASHVSLTHTRDSAVAIVILEN
jgi:holo-[acyl-carrier protein] synthase